MIKGTQTASAVSKVIGISTAAKPAVKSVSDVKSLNVKNVAVADNLGINPAAGVPAGSQQFDFGSLLGSIVGQVGNVIVAKEQTKAAKAGGSVSTPPITNAPPVGGQSSGGGSHASSSPGGGALVILAIVAFVLFGMKR